MGLLCGEVAVVLSVAMDLILDGEVYRIMVRTGGVRLLRSISLVFVLLLSNSDGRFWPLERDIFLHNLLRCDSDILFLY